MRLLTCSLLSLSACSEYDLQRGDDVPPGEVDSAPPPGDSPADSAAPLDECPEQSFPAEDAEENPECELAPQTGQFTPVVQWHMESFSVEPGSNNVMATPMVAHITDDDGDGVWGSAGDTPDVAVVTHGSANVLRVISGDGSGVHWSVSADSPQGQSMPAVADLDGDGDPEIVVATDSGRVVAYSHTGGRIWQSAAFVIDEGLFGADAVDFDVYCTAPAISDMDGDGAPEVIVGRVILDGRSGATLGVGTYGIGRLEGNVGTTSFAVDIDLDGEQEVIVGDAFYRRDGGLKNVIGDGDGYVAVGDFDDDPEGEVVVVRSGTVTVYHHDLSTLWGPVALGTSLGGPPTVADFDGDGEAEIGVAGISLYTVLDTDGSTLWTRGTQDATSGVTGSSVFDFEGDGIAEVVYADETRLWVFNGPDGEVKLESANHSSNTWLEYPAIADVDGDGHAEIVLGHNPYQHGPSNYYGITVIRDADDSWLGTRSVWNQHAYHITNVGDDASIPAEAETNWHSYNNFRSGDLHAGQGSAAPDLLPEFLDVCEECAQGTVYVWARARNEGAAASAPGARLSLYSGPTYVGEAVFADAIPAGATTESAVFELRPEQVEGMRLEVVVGGVECDESNNELVWTEGACE